MVRLSWSEPIVTTCMEFFHFSSPTLFSLCHANQYQNAGHVTGAGTRIGSQACLCKSVVWLREYVAVRLLTHLSCRANYMNCLFNTC